MPWRSVSARVNRVANYRRSGEDSARLQDAINSPQAFIDQVAIDQVADLQTTLSALLVQGVASGAFDHKLKRPGAEPTRDRRLHVAGRRQKTGH